MTAKTVRWRNAALQQGWTMVPNAVLDAPISPGAFRLWCVLADYARQDESCFPGQQGIAARLAVSARTVRTWITELVESDLLENIQRGLGRTNEYVLTLPDDPCSEADDRPVRKQAAEPTHVLQDALEEEETLSPDKPSKAEKDSVWDALEAVFGKPTTPQHRSRFGRVQKELLADTSLAPADVAAEVGVRAARYRAKWPGIDLTLEAFAKHWPDLRGGSSGPMFVTIPGGRLTPEQFRAWRSTASREAIAEYQHRFDVDDNGESLADGF